MSLLNFKKSPEQMERKLAGLQIEDEVTKKEAEIAEKKAIIAELKKQYGPSWMTIMGVKVIPDLQTLRSMFKGSRRGMREMANSFTGKSSSNVVGDLGHLRRGSDISHLRRL